MRIYKEKLVKVKKDDIHDGRFTVPPGVIKIWREAFLDNTSLEQVTLPESVTTIGRWAFQRCINLTQINLSDSVTKIGDYAFDGCKNLVQIHIPEHISVINQNTFRGCTNLRRVIVSDNIKEIDPSAFNRCDNLTQIHINAKNKASFERVKVLLAAALRKSAMPVLTFEYDANHILNTPSMTALYHLVPYDMCRDDEPAEINCLDIHGRHFSFPSGVTKVWDSAFAGCTCLTQITLPDSVTKIGRWAFHGCTGLTQITLPESLTVLEPWAFRDCKNLIEIKLSDNITNIDASAFEGCDRLSELQIYTESKVSFERLKALLPAALKVKAMHIVTIKENKINSPKHTAATEMQAGFFGNPPLAVNDDGAGEAIIPMDLRSV